MNIQNRIGKTNNVKTVAVINPPMITMAKGFCDSEPIPVEIAALHRETKSGAVAALPRLLASPQY